MTGETNLALLLKNMKAKLNDGDYVFCTVADSSIVNQNEIIGFFREEEAVTLILKKDTADRLHLKYDYLAAWITLTVHSSLNAVGLTAAFSNALARQSISCNVVAGYYHDHIFVAKHDADKAMLALNKLSGTS